MSRTQHYTAQQVIAALTATKGMQFLAAKQLGCAQETVSRYIKRYPSVAAAVATQRGEMIDITELKLWQAIQREEAWAIAFCLRTLGRDRGYAERTEHTGKDGGPLQVQTMAPDVRDARIAVLSAKRRNGQAQPVTPEVGSTS